MKTDGERPGMAENSAAVRLPFRSKPGEDAIEGSDRILGSARILVRFRADMTNQLNESPVATSPTHALALSRHGGNKVRWEKAVGGPSRAHSVCDQATRCRAYVT